MKKIIIIFLLILNSCGYTSIYKNQKDQNFQINVTEMIGDNEFNNLIKNELKMYSNINSNNIYDITINSNYQKIIVSKNLAGVATNFNIIAKAKLSVSFNGKIRSLNYNESINIKNNTNSFEQNNYEKNLKKNFASSIREKFIIEVSDLNDN